MADREAEYPGDALFVALTPIVYGPMLVEDALRTVIDVVALTPGLKLGDGFAKLAVQPSGRSACRLKLDGAQVELSLLVIVTV